jgi:hypothetical protein
MIVFQKIDKSGFLSEKNLWIDKDLKLSLFHLMRNLILHKLY